MNFEYVTYYIITAFGQTATTFTSQNHAAGEFLRCRRILRLCLGLSLLCSTVPFFAIVLFEIRSRGFLRRMLRSFRTQACGFCASCSLSRCAICMKYRRAFCATAGMRCIRRSARWLERAHFASPGFTQSSGQNRPSHALPCVSSFMGSDDCADCARASGAASFCARQRASAYNGAVSPRLTSGAGHLKREKMDLLKPQQIHFLCPYFVFALFQLRNSITTNGIPR